MQNPPQQVIVVIATISIILLFLGILFIVMLVYYQNKKKQILEEKRDMQQAFSQQLLQSQIETQEETMSLLGKELHDNVGQLLSSTKMLIGVTERGLTNPPETLLIADETLGKAIHELRSLSKSLNKEWLQQFNFIENLTAETERINTSKIITVNFQHPSALPLLADEQIILFRIVQESLQNAMKHAKAKLITISIEQQQQMLSVVIIDDGLGFDENEPINGLGILNIKHRTHLLGGTVQWHSAKKSGTKITIQLPIKNTE